MVLMSGVMKFMKLPAVVDGFAHLGLAESLALGLGILEMLCTVVYVIPRAAKNIRFPEPMPELISLKTTR